MALFKNLSMLSNHRALKITSFPTMSTNSKRHSALKQAPRAWYECLKKFLLKQGFEIGKVDPTLFTHKVGKDIFVCQIYVDDIIFGSTNHFFVRNLVRS